MRSATGSGALLALLYTCLPIRTTPLDTVILSCLLTMLPDYSGAGFPCPNMSSRSSADEPSQATNIASRHLIEVTGVDPARALPTQRQKIQS